MAAKKFQVFMQLFCIIISIKWKAHNCKYLHWSSVQVYFCIPTKNKILYQEYRDRKWRP